jgi:hypothetical protein
VTGPSLETILEERQAVGIGPVILGLVRSLTAIVTRTYDPVIYGNVATWQDGLEDLVHDVIVDRLLAEGQLDYAIDVATTPEAFRALLTRQIKRTLARRRRRTVVDNLLDRARDVLSSDYATREVGGHPRYRRAGAEPSDRAPTESELRAATLAAVGIAKVPSYSDDRAPIIYTTEALKALLAAVFSQVATDVSIADLDTIFRSALTGWIGSDLVVTRGGASETEASELTPDERLEVQTTVNEILTDLHADLVPVLRAKYAGVSDGDIARTLSMSRPTVAKRKAEALAIMRAHLDATGERVQDAVVEELGVSLARQES